jgi:hypothetical protein
MSARPPRGARGLGPALGLLAVLARLLVGAGCLALTAPAAEPAPAPAALDPLLWAAYDLPPPLPTSPLAARLEAAPTAVRFAYALRNRDADALAALAPGDDSNEPLLRWFRLWPTLSRAFDEAYGPGQTTVAYPRPLHFPIGLVATRLLAPPAGHRFPWTDDAPPLHQPAARAALLAAVRPRWALERENSFLLSTLDRIDAARPLDLPARQAAFAALALPPLDWSYHDQRPEDPEAGRPSDLALVGAPERIVPRPALEWSYRLLNRRFELPRAGRPPLVGRLFARIPVDAAGLPPPSARRVVVAFPYQGDRGGTFNIPSIKLLTTWHGLGTVGFVFEDYPHNAPAEAYGVPAEVFDAWLHEALEALAPALGGPSERVALWGLSRGADEGLAYAARPGARVELCVLSLCYGGHGELEPLVGKHLLLLNTLGAPEVLPAEDWARRARAAGVHVTHAVSRPNWPDRRPGLGLGIRHSPDFLGILLGAEWIFTWAHDRAVWQAWAHSGRGLSSPAALAALPGGARPEATLEAAAAPAVPQDPVLRALWPQLPAHQVLPLGGGRHAVAGRPATPPRGVLIVLHETDPAGLFPPEDDVAFATARHWAAISVPHGHPADLDRLSTWLDGQAELRDLPRALFVREVPAPEARSLAGTPRYAALTLVNPAPGWSDFPGEAPRGTRTALFTRDRRWAAHRFAWAARSAREPGAWRIERLEAAASDLEPGYYHTLVRLLEAAGAPGAESAAAPATEAAPLRQHEPPLPPGPPPPAGPVGARVVEPADALPRPRLVLLASALEEPLAGQIARVWADSGHRVLCVFPPPALLAPPLADPSAHDAETLALIGRVEEAAFGPAPASAPTRFAALGDAGPLLARWALAGRLPARDLLVLSPGARPAAPAGPAPDVAAEGGRWFRLAQPDDGPPAPADAEERLRHAGWSLTLTPLSSPNAAAQNSLPAQLRANREWADALARADLAPPAAVPRRSLSAVHRGVQALLAVVGAFVLAAATWLLGPGARRPPAGRTRAGRLAVFTARGAWALSAALYLHQAVLPLLPTGVALRLGLIPDGLAAALPPDELARLAHVPLMDVNDHVRLARRAAPGAAAPTAGIDPRWRREFWDRLTPWLLAEPSPPAREALIHDLLRAEVALRPAGAEGPDPEGDWLEAWQTRRPSPAQFAAILAAARGSTAGP